MITLRRTMVWIAAAILCLGFGTVATAEYIYDFDNGNVTTGLLTTGYTTGQDNWVRYYDPSVLDRGAMVTDYSTSGYTGIEGLAVTRGSDDSFDSRVNDANWGYSIPAGTEFSVEFNLRFSGHTYHNACFALAVDSDADGIHHGGAGGEVGFQFGCGGNKWYVRQADWKDGFKSSTGPTSGEIYRIVLDVDPMANSGDGSGSLSVQLLSGAGGDLTPVADLQGKSLGMLGMYDPDPSHWDGMFMRIGYGAIMDHLTITPIPEPSVGLLLILGLAGFGLFLRCR